LSVAGVYGMAIDLSKPPCSGGSQLSGCQGGQLALTDNFASGQMFIGFVFIYKNRRFRSADSAPIKRLELPAHVDLS
jgi:hypothetical protein